MGRVGTVSQKIMLELRVGHCMGAWTIVSRDDGISWSVSENRSRVKQNGRKCIEITKTILIWILCLAPMDTGNR